MGVERHIDSERILRGCPSSTLNRFLILSRNRRDRAITAGSVCGRCHGCTRPPRSCAREARPSLARRSLQAVSSEGASIAGRAPVCIENGDQNRLIRHLLTLNPRHPRLNFNGSWVGIEATQHNQAKRKHSQCFEPTDQHAGLNSDQSVQTQAHFCWVPCQPCFRCFRGRLFLFAAARGFIFQNRGGVPRGCFRGWGREHKNKSSCAGSGGRGERTATVA